MLCAKPGKTKVQIFDFAKRRVRFLQEVLGILGISLLRVSLEATKLPNNVRCHWIAPPSLSALSPVPDSPARQLRGHVGTHWTGDAILILVDMFAVDDSDENIFGFLVHEY